MHEQEGWLIDWLVTTLRDMDNTTALLSILGVLLLCGLGLPMPEDIILITAGFLSALGKFSLLTAIVLGMVGVLSGDAALFFLGRRYGPEVFELRLVRRIISPETRARAEARIQDNAAFVCFVARFLPGLRSPIYLTAGAMGIPPKTYVMQDGLAASISVPAWVFFGWYFGESIEQAMLAARQFQFSLLAGLAVFVVGYVIYKWRMSSLAVETEET